MLNNKYFLIVILITMNIVFHFIPFERASLAPDDYAYLVQSRDVSMRGIFQRMLNVSDRPLNYLILMLQGKFIGDNSVLALYLLVLSSIFVLLTVYYFLLKLFNQTILAFIGSAIFCLLPNKLETYHTLIFFNINMATGIYILSLTFFIRFVQIRKTVFLLLSLMAYTIGVFWYEVGFFLPLTLIGYCLIFDKKDYLKFLYYFLIPSLCYLFIRLLGSGGMNFSQHNVGFPGLLVANELFHHLMGRYILRSIFYGIYEFLLISRPLLYLLIAVDILLLALLREFLKRISLKEAGKGFLLFGIACFVFFIAPLFLNQGGGIGGRHLVLPSLGVVILILWLFGRIGKVRDRILLIFFAVLFVVCQGNAWTQVIA
ncbi:MAG: hypothetical protein KKH80_01415, partial [Candidatus Omnitrophica bacterium]|nr:hypothetical protein [Candidatus Omnitrophota bacterium]